MTEVQNYNHSIAFNNSLENFLPAPTIDRVSNLYWLGNKIYEQTKDLQILPKKLVQLPNLLLFNKCLVKPEKRCLYYFIYTGGLNMVEENFNNYIISPWDPESFVNKVNRALSKTLNAAITTGILTSATNCIQKRWENCFPGMITFAALKFVIPNYPELS